MKTVQLVRTRYEDKQTLGYLLADGIELTTLENPWLDNQRRISCIPEGKYKVIPHTSPKFGPCFWVQDVPGRSAILFHAGNYHADTLGCVLVGLEYDDLNKDGYADLVGSRKALKEMLTSLKEPFELVVSSL